MVIAAPAGGLRPARWSLLRIRFDIAVATACSVILACWALGSGDSFGSGRCGGCFDSSYGVGYVF